MSDYEIKKLEEIAKRISSSICDSIGWVALWTFFIMLQSCALANNSYQRETLDELKKQSQFLQQCVSPNAQVDADKEAKNDR